MKKFVHLAVFLTEKLIAFAAFVLLALAIVVIPGTATTVAVAQSATQATSQVTGNNTTSSSHLDLSSNECLQKLNAKDIVIASIAFKDGLNSAEQFKELVKRRPWGIGTPETAVEIKKQLETQSPFLIITLTKEQVLTLDDHRDIIRWVLVQSPVTACE